MNRTPIEWVKNPDGTQGYTWNPITGCLNGCEYCYARKLANGRLKQRYLANENILPLQTESPGYYTSKLIDNLDPFYPRFWSGRFLDKDLWNKTPKGIFAVDMGELFGDWIPLTWTEAILATINENPQHRFYLLTKQDQNLEDFSPFPDNCWVGVSVDGRDLGRPIYFLKRIVAKVKFISFEPLLYPTTQTNLVSNLDWVIIGSQTKPYKPPKIEWVEEIVRGCDKAGMPVFLKDNLYPLLGLGNGKSICHINETGVLRQEMPNED